VTAAADARPSRPRKAAAKAPARPRPAAARTTSPDEAREALAALRSEVGKAVIGQDATVTGLVIALLCRGHVLLEGVPGVAKTLLVRAVAASLRLETKRVQFTPDLMPGDITGSLV
jgi:MoxR-like ATPase